MARDLFHQITMPKKKKANHRQKRSADETTLTGDSGDGEGTNQEVGFQKETLDTVSSSIKKSKRAKTISPPPTVKPRTDQTPDSFGTSARHSHGTNAVTTANVTSLDASQTTILENYPNLLEDLLSPGALTVQDFLQTKFRQEAYHVPAVTLPSSRRLSDKQKESKSHRQTDSASDPHPRMAGIVERLFDLDVEQLMEHTASENIFVWLKDHTTNSPLIRSIEVGDSETALALYRAGHSTYFRAPPELEELLVPALLENTGLGCGQYHAVHNSNTRNGMIPVTTASACLGRGEIELFLSAQAGAVTEWHYDFQENFTLQLSGRKKWTLQHSTPYHVLSRAVTPHYQAESVVEGQLLAARLASATTTTNNNSKECNGNEQKEEHNMFQFGPPDPTARHNARGEPQEVILEPGDVLYFPAGMWHKVQVLEPGVSLNISLMAMNYASLTCQALEHYLLQRHGQWRQTILTHHYHDRATYGTTNLFNESLSHSSSPRSAVEQLQYLLEHDLTQAVHDLLQKHGGASAILPPVLHNGQMTNPLNGDGKHGNHNNTDDQEDNDDQEDHDTETIDDENDNETSPGEETDLDEHGTVIPMDDQPPPRTLAFDPSHAALTEKLKTHRLIRNPLAMLIRNDDITRYYKSTCHDTTQKDDSDRDERAGTLFVLNFNFAGSELSRESFVRATLSSMTHAALDTMFLDEQNADDQSTALIQSGADKDCNTVAWLVYLGYLVWVKRRL